MHTSFSLTSRRISRTVHTYVLSLRATVEHKTKIRKATNAQRNTKTGDILCATRGQARKHGCVGSSTGHIQQCCSPSEFASRRKCSTQREKGICTTPFRFHFSEPKSNGSHVHWIFRNFDATVHTTLNFSLHAARFAAGLADMVTFVSCSAHHVKIQPHDLVEVFFPRRHVGGIEGEFARIPIHRSLEFVSFLLLFGRVLNLPSHSFSVRHLGARPTALLSSALQFPLLCAEHRHGISTTCSYSLFSTRTRIPASSLCLEPRTDFTWSRSKPNLTVTWKRKLLGFREVEALATVEALEIASSPLPDS